MKKFYGVHRENGKYILTLTGYDPSMKGEVNPHTGQPTHFKTLEVVDIYDDKGKAMLECERLNIGIVEGV